MNIPVIKSKILIIDIAVENLAVFENYVSGVEQVVDSFEGYLPLRLKRFLMFLNS